jgi:hypothetical protein
LYILFFKNRSLLSPTFNYTRFEWKAGGFRRKLNWTKGRFPLYSPPSERHLHQDMNGAIEILLVEDDASDVEFTRKA